MLLTEENENKIALFMKNLDITREEAIDLLEYDRQIDDGAENLGKLPKEKEKASRQIRRIPRKPKMYTFKTNRKKEEDQDKRYLLNLIFGALTHENIKDLAVTIEERQIEFNFNDRKFRIALSATRT